MVSNEEKGLPFNLKKASSNFDPRHVGSLMYLHGFSEWLGL